MVLQLATSLWGLIMTMGVAWGRVRGLSPGPVAVFKCSDHPGLATSLHLPLERQGWGQCALSLWDAAQTVSPNSSLAGVGQWTGSAAGGLRAMGDRPWPWGPVPPQGSVRRWRGSSAPLSQGLWEEARQD
jgi:hypothetical protein